MTINTQLLLLEIMAIAMEDPLIDWKTEKTIELLVWVVIIAFASVVGLLSRRLEHAIFFALVSSIITIAFFVIS